MQPVELLAMLPQLRLVPMPKLRPTGWVVPKPFPQFSARATSLIHSSIFDSVFFTLRGQSRLINTRLPSERLGGS
jgi:hypothetical protein